MEMGRTGKEGANEVKERSIRLVVERRIEDVYDSMQPELGRIYEGTYCNPRKGSSAFAVIRLDNGKPLILRPGEFREVE